MLAGDAIADDVDDAAPDAPAATVGEDATGEPQAATRQTLEMPMKAPTTALRAVLVIRELNMALIGPVNH